MVIKPIVGRHYVRGNSPMAPLFSPGVYTNNRRDFPFAGYRQVPEVAAGVAGGGAASSVSIGYFVTAGVLTGTIMWALEKFVLNRLVK
jgi:hypothetical protein